ncbi:clostripain-related cysteine peptidase [Gehongia tenuis]|uniref:Clostripain n=1 Tax=Gehongia tenuis TaxID=2763655 RepID=A0A926D4P7_9FIRM|nr:clostripain-related cysteine peptidase [Gehongia tenuis]MBC8530295.1 hypothetical protein [Gehongia tenuis]
MKRKMVLALVILVLFAAGCQPKTPASAAGTPPESGSWTVLIYLCGSDLESQGAKASQNLAELAAVDKPDGINVLVQAGGASDWHTEGFKSERSQRFLLEDHDWTLVDEGPLLNMGEADTLGDFLAYGTERYPAERTMALIWNHGGGSVAGAAFDELFDGDSLTLPELSQAFAASGTKFDLIGFDCCLMASLETAAALAPHGGYMAASEEYEPGGGWDYGAFLAYLGANPECTPVDLGKVICDSYYAKCLDAKSGAMATLSLIDLSSVPALTAAFDAMAKEMSASAVDISALQAFAQGARQAEHFGGNTEEEGFTNMVDLGDLARQTEAVLPDTAAGVTAALEQAVVYQITGESRQGSSGLSVFYPLASSTALCDAYAKAATSSHYLRYIQAVTGWSPSEELALPNEQPCVQAVDYAVASESYITPDGYYALHINSDLDAVEAVEFSLYYMDYRSGRYVLLGMDNDIDANWTSGLFLDNFRGVWPTLNGLYCAPTLISGDENTNLYSIPIKLNGKKTNLRAAYVWDENGENGHYEIYGAWDGLSSGGMSSREVTPLKDGDRVELLFSLTNWETGEDELYAMGAFTVQGDVVMEESELVDGDYLYQYRITDVFGRVTTSPAIIMECKEGEIFLYETADPPSGEPGN